jgi:hypothetical protein
MTQTPNGPTPDLDQDAPKGDPISHLIVALCEENGSTSPQEVAKAFFADHRKAKDPADGWRRYMNPVKQQMVHLARTGVVEITRKGEAVDPNDFRGLVRIRLVSEEAANRDQD